MKLRACLGFQFFVRTGTQTRWYLIQRLLCTWIMIDQISQIYHISSLLSRTQMEPPRKARFHHISPINHGFVYLYFVHVIYNILHFLKAAFSIQLDYYCTYTCSSIVCSYFCSYVLNQCLRRSLLFCQVQFPTFSSVRSGTLGFQRSGLPRFPCFEAAKYVGFVFLLLPFPLLSSCFYKHTY